MFMKRLINYSLQAFERYEVDPVVLVICTNAVSDRVAQVVETTDVPACCTFPSIGWASTCLIATRTRAQERIDSTSLNQFAALCLFLTSQAVTINDSLCPDDPTMQYLYQLALQRHQTRLGDQHVSDTLVQVLENQDKEYTRTLELTDKEASSEAVAQAIKTLQSQNQATKRKFNDITAGPSSPSTSKDTNAESSNSIPGPSTSSYEQGMMFVESYKNARTQRGLKRMDWIDCYSKGLASNMFQYKSADVLRNQFNILLSNKN